ncbi:virulence-associated E family protein [Mesorhizobium huakuii]|uniref:Virulence-associated E family protein n=1 Tax=Mesorhizobium huakuii TaxID=28104 RepID=A0ABZ0VQP1_9HYPH|nr:virulence-associated E family protein [Mesorhizobium huakuii]WQB99533.1 virulence-associated E family protein [Mesorhizobium huakuii]
MPGRFKPDGGTTFAMASATGKQVRFIVGNGIGVITLHNCVADGVIEPWAKELVESCNSYAEVSGGTVNIFVRGCQHLGKDKRGKLIHKWSKGRVSIATADADCPVSGARVGAADLSGATKETWQAVMSAAPLSHSGRIRLDLDANQNVKKTPDNASNIVTHHAVMQGVFAWDEFFERTRVQRQPDGKHFTGKHWEGGIFSDAHADDVRTWLSASSLNGGIGADFSKDITHLAIGRAARENLIHPIRDWLTSLPSWDGVDRVETLFIDYLRCPDTLYHREAALLWLVAAVARVFEPGHKFDFMPIVEGPQGSRKSTFVAAIGMEWGGAPTIDWSNSQKMIEQTQGYWIIEVGELASLNKAEANDVKESLVKTEDRARLAYAHEPVSRRRQCVFMGTTNDDQYLKDPTGNRRYWPIKTAATAADPIDIDRLKKKLPSIWAEALFLYEAMRDGQREGPLNLSLSREAEREAAVLQASRRAESDVEILAGQIEAWLGQPESDFDIDEPKRYRTTTCTAQVWREMLQRDGSPAQLDAMRIGKALATLTGWKRSPGPVFRDDLKAKYGRVIAYDKEPEPSNPT